MTEPLGDRMHTLARVEQHAGVVVAKVVGRGRWEPGRRAPAVEQSYADPPVEVSIPKGDRLDHQPTKDEILDTLRAGLGDVEVIDVRKHPTYRNSYGREVDLKTCTPAALHGAYKDLLYGKRKKKPKPEGEQ